MAYLTREIQDRVPQGNPFGVQLAAGPDGRVDGSYEFFSNANSYIQFNNGDGGVLDVRYSITMLFWVYYDGANGPLFFYRVGPNVGVSFSIVETLPSVQFTDRDYNVLLEMGRSSQSLAGGWKFVGASYDGNTGEAKLWIDGVAVETTNIGGGVDLATQGNFIVGAHPSSPWYFKGRITQMRLYNISLLQEQVHEIMGKSHLQIL